MCSNRGPRNSAQGFLNTSMRSDAANARSLGGACWSGLRLIGRFGRFYKPLEERRKELEQSCLKFKAKTCST